VVVRIVAILLEVLWDFVVQIGGSYRFGHNVKGGHVCGRARGTGRGQMWVQKIESFRPWCAAVERTKQEYTGCPG
jgi:hypothetical protein